MLRIYKGARDGIETTAKFTRDRLRLQLYYLHDFIFKYKNTFLCVVMCCVLSIPYTNYVCSWRAAGGMRGPTIYNTTLANDKLPSPKGAPGLDKKT